MEYLTGYAKQNGHVVLEKAVIKGIPAAMAVCGDLPYIPIEEGVKPVTGESKGALAGFFLRDFTEGVKAYGEDYLQAAVFAFSTSPAGKEIAFGPGLEFGTGSAGILAAGENAYVYSGEGSGMCIVRLAEVFGKKKFVKCISQKFGGEDVIGLGEGCVVLVCPEKWADEILIGSSAEERDAFIAALNPCDISDDDSLDRHLREIAGDSSGGCLAALLVK